MVLSDALFLMMKYQLLSFKMRINILEVLVVIVLYVLYVAWDIFCLSTISCFSMAVNSTYEN